MKLLFFPQISKNKNIFDQLLILNDSLARHAAIAFMLFPYCIHIDVKALIIPNGVGFSG
jgi:hypothetical protein